MLLPDGTAGVVRRRPAHRPGSALDDAASCTASRSESARLARRHRPAEQSRPRAGSRPISGRRCCTRAARRGSSRRRVRARPPCSSARFRHLVVERGYGAASVCALAYNRRAGAEMQERLGDLPRDAQRKVRTLNSFGYDIVRRARPERARDRRARDPQPDRAAPHAAVPGQHRRAAARTSKRSKRCSSGCARPSWSRCSAATSRASRRCTAQYRDGLARDDAIDFDGQIAAAIETLLREPGAAARAAARVPAPARRRVPRPPARAPAARAPRRRARVRRVRRRRRRPGDLRLLRRRSRLPHRLRRLLPRRRRPSARGQLPLPAARGRRRAHAARAQPAPGRQGDARRARADSPSSRDALRDRAARRRRRSRRTRPT